VLAVAVVILSTAGSDRGQTAAPSASPALAVLHEAARAAAAGTAAPVIGPGQAWHTVWVSVVTTQRTHSASSRSAVTRSTTELDKWIGADGMEDEQGQTGSRGAGFAGIGVPASAPGFGDWDPIAPPGGRGLPAAAAAVPAFLRCLSAGDYLRPSGPTTDTDHSPFTQLAELSALLGDWPLRPAARATAVAAIARLPGLRYRGRESDVLRHPGVAVSEDGIGLPAFALTGPHPPRQDYRFTLIFDPARGLVLGSRTTLLSRLPLSGTHPGQLLLAWAYQPGLPQPGEVTPLPPRDTAHPTPKPRQ
jgi:hypothetical protein